MAKANQKEKRKERKKGEPQDLVNFPKAA